MGVVYTRAGPPTFSISPCRTTVRRPACLCRTATDIPWSCSLDGNKAKRVNKNLFAKKLRTFVPRRSGSRTESFAKKFRCPDKNPATRSRKMCKAWTVLESQVGDGFRVGRSSARMTTISPSGKGCPLPTWIARTFFRGILAGGFRSPSRGQRLYDPSPAVSGHDFLPLRLHHWGPVPGRYAYQRREWRREWRREKNRRRWHRSATFLLLLK